MNRQTRSWPGRAGWQFPLPGIDLPPIDPLFFAIYPEPRAASQATQVAQRFHDASGLKCSLIPPEGLHISLHSLGKYFGPRHANLTRGCEAAAAVRFSPFKVKFDRVTTFKGRPGSRPFVLYGGGEALAEFWNVLGTAMTKAGMGRLVNTSYTPHVTLLYAKGRIPEETVESIEWIVREFVLVRSLHGQTQHVPLARWALRGERIGLDEGTRRGYPS
jgi:2'-5' RNA ligase